MLRSAKEEQYVFLLSLNPDSFKTADNIFLNRSRGNSKGTIVKVAFFALKGEVALPEKNNCRLWSLYQRYINIGAQCVHVWLKIRIKLTQRFSS